MHVCIQNTSRLKTIEVFPWSPGRTPKRYNSNFTRFYLVIVAMRKQEETVRFIEGSLEVKLPTIWTDEKQRWSRRIEKRRAEERRGEERRAEEK